MLLKWGEHAGDVQFILQRTSLECQNSAAGNKIVGSPSLTTTVPQDQQSFNPSPHNIELYQPKPQQQQQQISPTSGTTSPQRPASCLQGTRDIRKSLTFSGGALPEEKWPRRAQVGSSTECAQQQETAANTKLPQHKTHPLHDSHHINTHHYTQQDAPSPSVPPHYHNGTSVNKEYLQNANTNQASMYGSRSTSTDVALVGSPPVSVPFPRPAAPPPYEVARGHPPPPLHDTGGSIRGRRQHSHSPTSANPYAKYSPNTLPNGPSHMRRSEDKENIARSTHTYSPNVSETSNSFEMASNGVFNGSYSSGELRFPEGSNVSSCYSSSAPTSSRTLVRHLGGSPGSAFSTPTRAAPPRMLPPYRPPPPPPCRLPPPQPHHHSSLDAAAHKHNNTTLSNLHHSQLIANGSTNNNNNNNHDIMPRNDSQLRKNTSANKYSRLELDENSFNSSMISRNNNSSHIKNSTTVSNFSSTNSQANLYNKSVPVINSERSEAYSPSKSINKVMLTEGSAAQSAFYIANSNSVTQSSSSSIISLTKFSKSHSVGSMEPSDTKDGKSNSRFSSAAQLGRVAPLPYEATVTSSNAGDGISVRHPAVDAVIQTSKDTETRHNTTPETATTHENNIFATSSYTSEEGRGYSSSNISAAEEEGQCSEGVEQCPAAGGSSERSAAERVVTNTLVVTNTSSVCVSSVSAPHPKPPANSDHSTQVCTMLPTCATSYLVQRVLLQLYLYQLPYLILLCTKLQNTNSGSCLGIYSLPMLLKFRYLFHYVFTILLC